MALSRVFLGAGARVVVGTLWPIRDDHAAHFFASFYKTLAQGRPVGVALFEARRQAIRDGMPVAAWSSVVAIGDGNVTMLVPRRSRTTLQLLVTAVTGLALIIALAAIARRLRVRTAAG